jgi:Leucine-rich repeat (LRR) protein
MGNKDSKSNKSGGQQETFPDIDDLNDSNIEKYFADAKKAGTLKSIERLDLSQKELNEIPPQIAKLPNLKILHLYDNNFKDIPSFIGIVVLCGVNYIT